MTSAGVNTPAPIDPAVLEQVRTLAADRQRLELWIAGIDRANIEAPSHVRERVRADYVQRHATVDGQLRAHVTQLVPVLRALDQRATEIADQAQRDADERAEAQLRHAVGEFDDARWRDVRQRADASLTALAGEHKRVERQRTELQQVLALVGDEAVQGAEASANVSASAATSASASASASTSAYSVPLAAPPAAPATPSVPPAAPAVPKPVPPAVKQPEPQLLTLSLDIGVVEEASASMDAMSARDRSREIGAATAPDTSARTLRCAECGTMNRPTEWYCEKCGGELAAL